MADLGAALAAYNQGNTGPLLSLVQQMNLPLTQQTVEFLSDEQDMAIASGRTGLFNGWSLPAGSTSRNDFFALMTAGEAFAAASGWQYFLTPAQLAWGAANGIAQLSQRQIWQWMASANPATKAMPWLEAGMSQQQFSDYGNRLTDVWQQYTGNTNVPSDTLATAAAGNWSAQRFQQFLTTDPGVTGTYGWIKHGLTYNDFQQYKLNNKTQVAQRFGANAGDSQYLQMLNTPLTQFNAQGATVQTGQGQTSVAASGFGRQSEAR